MRNALSQIPRTDPKVKGSVTCYKSPEPCSPPWTLLFCQQNDLWVATSPFNTVLFAHHLKNSPANSAFVSWQAFKMYLIPCDSPILTLLTVYWFYSPWNHKPGWILMQVMWYGKDYRVRCKCAENCWILISKIKLWPSLECRVLLTISHNIVSTNQRGHY